MTAAANVPPPTRNTRIKSTARNRCSPKTTCFTFSADQARGFRDLHRAPARHGRPPSTGCSVYRRRRPLPSRSAISAWVVTHPHADVRILRPGFHFRQLGLSFAVASASAARANATSKPSPARRTRTRRDRRSPRDDGAAAFKRPASPPGASCQSRVEPSISVNRKVTVPDGAPAPTARASHGAGHARSITACPASHPASARCVGACAVVPAARTRSHRPSRAAMACLFEPALVLAP